jgi:hypothetical protein
MIHNDFQRKTPEEDRDHRDYCPRTWRHLPGVAVAQTETTAGGLRHRQRPQRGGGDRRGHQDAAPVVAAWAWNASHVPVFILSLAANPGRCPAAEMKANGAPPTRRPLPKASVIHPVRPVRSRFTAHAGLLIALRPVWPDGVRDGQWVGRGHVPDHPDLPDHDSRLGAERGRVSGPLGYAWAVRAQGHRAAGRRPVDGRRGARGPLRSGHCTGLTLKFRSGEARNETDC